MAPPIIITRQFRCPDPMDSELSNLAVRHILMYISMKPCCCQSCISTFFKVFCRAAASLNTGNVRVVCYSLIQVRGANRSSIGNSSRRPASMSNIRIYLLMGLKIPKLQVGPTLESPGPMLFKVAAIAVKFVVRSKLSMLMSSRDTEKIRI